MMLVVGLRLNRGSGTVNDGSSSCRCSYVVAFDSNVCDKFAVAKMRQLYP